MKNINVSEIKDFENVLLNAIKNYAIDNNRSVLLIFEYIFDAQNFYNLFKQKLQNAGLKLILYLK